ncbi:MAG: acyl-CoA dehydrogenase family protein [Candidatus Binatia bacterium]
MDFGLSQEQEMFQLALRRYLARQMPLEKVRTLMESDTVHDGAFFTGLAAQGITGILVPERYGGSGLGLLDAAIASTELGRSAAPLSFHSACVMAPLALVLSDNHRQEERWLPLVARGEAVLSWAGGRLSCAGGQLDGSVGFVADPSLADAFVVRAGSGRASRLLLVPRGTPGLSVVELEGVDLTRRLGELVFEGVAVDESLLLSTEGVDEISRRVSNAGRVALAADDLGACGHALDVAVEYSLQRKQFGRAIGSFQAVKHMCAETVAELEPLRSLIWYAAFAWDEQREDLETVVALAKAHAAEVGSRAVMTTTQVLGGMGFTWECNMHLWFKRAAYDRQVLGSPAEMRSRAAASQFGI